MKWKLFWQTQDQAKKRNRRLLPWLIQFELTTGRKSFADGISNETFYVFLCLKWDWTFHLSSFRFFISFFSMRVWKKGGTIQTSYTRDLSLSCSPSRCLLWGENNREKVQYRLKSKIVPFFYFLCPKVVAECLSGWLIDMTE